MGRKQFVPLKFFDYLSFALRNDFDSGSTSLLVLAAGMGSRYGGLKQADPVGPNGETLMDYSIHDARVAGFSRVVFLIREEMQEIFDQRLHRNTSTRWR